MRALFIILMLPLAQAASASDSLQPWFEQAQTVGAVFAEIDSSGATYHTFGHVQTGSQREPDHDTAFEIGSITKVFTNLLLAEMVAKGLVSQDTTLAELMPGLVFANEAVGSIRLIDLATHRSGLPRLPGNLSPGNPADPYADFDAEQLRVSVSRASDVLQLRREYAYSNLGVGLLGHLLGQLDGQGYHAALKRHVLKPLGIEHAYLNCADGGSATGHVGGQPVPHWSFQSLAGAGSLCASARDLARLVTVYLREEAVFEHDLEQDLAVVGPAGNGNSITAVWHVVEGNDRRVYWHNGGTGGFRSFVGFDPQRNQGWVLLVNSDRDVTGLGMELLGVAESPPSDVAQQPKVNSGELDALSGYFAISPQFGLTVTHAQSRLYVQGTGQPRLTLDRISPERFSVREVDAELEFHRNADGRVVALTLHQNGMAQRADRVSE